MGRVEVSHKGVDLVDVGGGVACSVGGRESVGGIELDAVEVRIVAGVLDQFSRQSVVTVDDVSHDDDLIDDSAEIHERGFGEVAEPVAVRVRSADRAARADQRRRLGGTRSVAGEQLDDALREVFDDRELVG